MTAQEWRQIATVRNGLWPHAAPLTAEQMQLGFEVVKDVPYEAALRCVYSMSREGREWPPTAGMIANCALTRTPLPYPDAEQLIRKAASRFGRNREQEALTWLAEQDAGVARLVVEHGWERLCNEEIDSPQHGGAVVARLEKAYWGAVNAEAKDAFDGRGGLLVQRRMAALGDGKVRADGLRKPDLTSVVQPPAGEIGPGDA